MIDFRPVQLSDKPWMDACIAAENSRSCEFNFTNIYLWRNYFQMQVAEVCGRLLFRACSDGVARYSFPIGPGDLRAAVLALLQDAEARGETFILRSITAENAEWLDRLFPCTFDFTPERQCFDYVYSAERLVTLTGKALHAKRNHINKFEKTYSIIAFGSNWAKCNLKILTTDFCQQLFRRNRNHAKMKIQVFV